MQHDSHVQAWVCRRCLDLCATIRRERERQLGMRHWKNEDGTYTRAWLDSTGRDEAAWDEMQRLAKFLAVPVAFDTVAVSKDYGTQRYERCCPYKSDAPYPPFAVVAEDYDHWLTQHEDGHVAWVSKRDGTTVMGLADWAAYEAESSELGLQREQLKRDLLAMRADAPRHVRELRARRRKLVPLKEFKARALAAVMARPSAESYEIDGTRLTFATRVQKENFVKGLGGKLPPKGAWVPQNTGPGGTAVCGHCGERHAVIDSDPGGLYAVKCPVSGHTYLVGLEAGPARGVTGQWDYWGAKST